MNETNNDQKKYEVVARYIKDISFEIPTPDSFVDAAQNLGEYSTKLELNSNPHKNNLIAIDCNFKLEAPQTIQNKIHAEVCISIIFKLTDPKMTAEEVKKIGKFNAAEKDGSIARPEHISMTDFEEAAAEAWHEIWSDYQPPYIGG